MHAHYANNRYNINDPKSKLVNLNILAEKIVLKMNYLLIRVITNIEEILRYK